MRVGVMAAACAFAFSPLSAQDSTRAAQDSAVRVFLDCPDTFCDFDYYRTEITFVNWVRDRQFAQVHILVTTQRTPGGHRLYGARQVDRLRSLRTLIDTHDIGLTEIAFELRMRTEAALSQAHQLGGFNNANFGGPSNVAFGIDTSDPFVPKFPLQGHFLFVIISRVDGLS